SRGGVDDAHEGICTHASHSLRSALVLLCILQKLVIGTVRIAGKPFMEGIVALFLRRALESERLCRAVLEYPDSIAVFVGFNGLEFRSRRVVFLPLLLFGIGSGALLFGVRFRSTRIGLFALGLLGILGFRRLHGPIVLCSRAQRASGDQHSRSGKDR